jgi:hypothetical protein
VVATSDFGSYVATSSVVLPIDLLGIPEEGQEAVRRGVDERLRVREGGSHEFDPSSFGDSIRRSPSTSIGAPTTRRTI